MTISTLDKYLERMEKYTIYEPKGGRNVWGVWYSEASYYQLQHSKKRLSWATPSTFNLRLTCIYFWDIIENWRQKSSYLEITKTSEKTQQLWCRQKYVINNKTSFWSIISFFTISYPRHLYGHVNHVTFKISITFNGSL